MNCVELHESLTESDGWNSAEQRAHLKTCPDCSALVPELNLIVSAATELRAADEPSPRVWKSIEMALRREGLVRPQRSPHSLLPSFSSPWGLARWMAPVAAALLIAVGIYVRVHAPAGPIVDGTVPHPPVYSDGSDLQVAGLNDADLMQELGEQSPAMQAQYTENLRHVNQYIQDAKDEIAADPNDEEARRSLMEAYQEKAMLFELALDRSLP